MHRVGIFCTGIMLALCFSTAFAIASHRSRDTEGPWFTGPLLAPEGIVEPPGGFNAEPYLYYTKTYNTPRIYTIHPELDFTQGLAKRLDVEFILPYNFNEAQGQHANYFQDITVILGVQAIRTHRDEWPPNFHAIIQETFPTGHYNRLNPDKFSTDSTGGGSYQTGIGGTFEQLYTLNNGHYLAARLYLVYTLPAHVNVNGFNTYGGGFGTQGTVRPGNSFSSDFAFEYTLTLNWVLALDTVYTVAGATKFSGSNGTDVDGNPTTTGNPRNQVISFAPAIEYNFNQHLGIIAGVWASAYAYHTKNFTSAVVAVNYNN